MIGMFILAILIMAIGMLGTLAPVLPGIPIIFLSMLGYGWYEHFQNITPGFLMIMRALTMLSLLANYISTSYPAAFPQGLVFAVLDLYCLCYPH